MYGRSAYVINCPISGRNGPPQQPQFLQKLKHMKIGFIIDNLPSLSGRLLLRHNRRIGVPAKPASDLNCFSI